MHSFRPTPIGLHYSEVYKLSRGVYSVMISTATDDKQYNINKKINLFMMYYLIMYTDCSNGSFYKHIML